MGNKEERVPEVQRPSFEGFPDVKVFVLFHDTLYSAL